MNSSATFIPEMLESNAIVKILYPIRFDRERSVAHHLLRTTQRYVSTNDPKGYFAALYYHVAARIKEAIEEGSFSNAAAISELNTTFYHRYLEALENDKRGCTVPCSWEKAFAAGRKDIISVKQHLLLGMNAHINFDLPVAAVKVFPGASIIEHYDDFLKINDILSGLYLQFIQSLAAFWPPHRFLHFFNGILSRQVLDKNMRKVRERAWVKALYLAGLKGGNQQRAIRLLDRQVGLIAGKIIYPARPVSDICKAIKHYERGTVADRIHFLLY